MQIPFCIHCHSVFSQDYKTCPWDNEPLDSVDARQLETKGDWRVFFSLGRQISSSLAVLDLARENPETAFLFRNNLAVDENRHARLTPVHGSLVSVCDNGSMSGTFLQKKSGEWHRLQPQSSVEVPSGIWIRLGQETLGQCWIRWEGKNVETHESQAARTVVDLAASFHEISPQVFIERRHKYSVLRNDNEAERRITHNGRLVAMTVLRQGDRIYIEGRGEYEYATNKLIPANPLLAPNVAIHATVKRRLKIDNLCIEHGKFMGVIGESGAGKTTLIKLMTGWLRPTNGTVEFEVQDKTLSVREYKKNIVYVPQYDIVYDSLTIQDSLFYSALLKSGKKKSGVKRNPSDVKLEERIEYLLQQTGLLEHRNKKISKLSGGQRKRVNIASELLAEESALLVLDEPTSGLDLATDYRIMEWLRRLSVQGRTVVCITHHLANMQLFDEVVILEKNRSLGMGQLRYQQQRTPAEIAYEYQCTLEKPNSYNLFDVENEESRPVHEKSMSAISEMPGIREKAISGHTENRNTPDNSESRITSDNHKNRNASDKKEKHKPKIAAPWFATLFPCKWWVLLCRRLNEFFHPAGDWINFLSMLFFIPLLIGVAISIAFYGSADLQKIAFLCSVAAFWLGMSISSQEMQPDRYRIFLHEKLSGVKPSGVFISLILFFLFVSSIQTGILMSPVVSTVFKTGEQEKLKRHCFDFHPIVFSYAPEIITQLDREILPTQLKTQFRQFAGKLPELSEETKVWTLQTGQKWQLYDPKYKKDYTLTREKFHLVWSFVVPYNLGKASISESEIQTLNQGGIPENLKTTILEDYNLDDARIDVRQTGISWSIRIAQADFLLEYEKNGLSVQEIKYKTEKTDLLQSYKNGLVENILRERIRKYGVELPFDALLYVKGEQWQIRTGQQTYQLDRDEDAGVLHVRHVRFPVQARDNSGSLRRSSVVSQEEILAGLELLTKLSNCHNVTIPKEIQNELNSSLKENNSQASLRLSPSAQISMQTRGEIWEIQDQGKNYRLEKKANALELYEIESKKRFTVYSPLLSSVIVQELKKNGILLQNDSCEAMSSQKKQWLLDGRYQLEKKDKAFLSVYRVYPAVCTVIVYLFFILAMGVAGTIGGLDLSCLHSWTSGRLPTSVTVPSVTVIQLIFSKMVMGIKTEEFYHPFSFYTDHIVRDSGYFVTFSRYPDIAVRFLAENSYYIDNIFYRNLFMFSGIALLIPALVLYLFLKIAKAGE